MVESFIYFCIYSWKEVLLTIYYYLTFDFSDAHKLFHLDYLIIIMRCAPPVYEVDARNNQGNATDQDDAQEG